RRRRPPPRPRRRPWRLQGGRPHAAARDHFVEHGQMPRLLLRHGADLRRMRRPISHYRALSGVNAGGAIFTGVVDPDHRRAVSHAGRSLAARAQIATAATVEMIALKPASDMPAKVQGATSQRTSGAFMMAASGSPPTSAMLLVQPVIPSHQPYSTPAWNAPIKPDTKMASPARAIHSRLGAATVDSSASAMAMKCG